MSSSRAHLSCSGRDPASTWEWVTSTSSWVGPLRRWAEFLKVDSLSDLSGDQMSALRRAFQDGGIRGYWRRRAELTERDAKGKPDALQVALMWADAGDVRRTVDWLERAHRDRAVALVFLGVVPELSEARSDPRVVAIMKAMGLQPVEHVRYR